LYYRRKLLLALLEIFDGELRPIDCQKLMFLYCQRKGVNHYDFFPYKYGACSFMLHQDKLRLTDLGYLEEGENFKLKGKVNFLNQLEPSSQMALHQLLTEIGGKRGNELLRKVYVEYPYFATKSLVAKDILNPTELNQVSLCEETDTSHKLFTIGYEGITIDKYLETLVKHNVFCLVDVRKNPISQKYGFSKNQLKRYVENIGVTYIHLPQLGIPSNMRQHLTNEQEYQTLFQTYQNEILPEQTAALDELSGIMEQKVRIALTCFEATHTFCHRSKITEYFANQPNFNLPIIHL
jgi:uncharacterized protein (DUF488 family)